MLFPSAIMFGMSSKEFWEDDPQLYWSYRTFYLKKMQQDSDLLYYESWLYGSYTHLAVFLALNNAFSKKKEKYPEKPFRLDINKEKTELEEKLKKEPDKDIRQQMEFNYWARL